MKIQKGFVKIFSLNIFSLDAATVYLRKVAENSCCEKKKSKVETNVKLVY